MLESCTCNLLLSGRFRSCVGTVYILAGNCKSQIHLSQRQERSGSNYLPAGCTGTLQLEQPAVLMAGWYIDVIFCNVHMDIIHLTGGVAPHSRSLEWKPAIHSQGAATKRSIVSRMFPRVSTTAPAPASAS